MPYSTEDLEFFCESFHNIVDEWGNANDKKIDKQITVAELGSLFRKNAADLPKLSKTEQEKYLYTLVVENYNLSDEVRKELSKIYG